MADRHADADIPAVPGASAPEAEDTEVWQDVPLADGQSGTDESFAERIGALALDGTSKLIVSAGAPPDAVEQYRRLAAVMYQAQADRGTRVVMITSTVPAEGKSLTATNLALTLSESYRQRVLLVDADLRRPTLHDVFQIPNLAGISDWLKGTGAGKMPLVQVTRHLTLLPGGRPDPDPMSALVSDRMKQVLTRASERFDWVIVDTPPVAGLPDGHLLAALVDTIVFVVAAGRTPAAAVQRAVEQLGRDRIIGVVLNRVEGRSLQAYGHGSHYERYRYSPVATGGER